VRERRLAAEGALVIAALFYGITFPLVRDALQDITPFAYLVGRFTVATLCIAPFAIRVFRRSNRETRRLVLRAGALAGVLLFAGYATQTVGLQYTSASTSAFITGLNVVFVPVIVACMDRRLPSRPVGVGIALAVVGLYLLTGADVALGRGVLLTLACAVLFAFHIVCIGAYVNRVPQASFTTAQVAVVAVLCLPPTAVQGTGSVTTLAAMDAGLATYDETVTHHYRLRAAAVHELTERLLATTRADRARIPVMHPGRIDVIGAGALILSAIVERVGVDEVLVSEHDILDGIAWSLT